MLGKVIEFKPLVGQKKASPPAVSNLADEILQQFLDEADAPFRKANAPARVYAFASAGKSGALRVITRVQLRLTLPFTFVYWLDGLH